MKKSLTPAAAGLLLVLGAGLAHAANDIVGQELMTEQEQADYRATLKSLKTEEAKEAFRTAHEERMKQRAEHQGVELPTEATAAGRPGKGADMKDHMDKPRMPQQ